MKSRPVPSELRVFLEAFDPAIGRLFLRVRAAVLEAAPTATELVYDAYNAVSTAYTFSDRLADGFLHVAGYASHVNLGFNRGAALDDPERILVGKGARVRHIRIDRAAELKRPEVRRLLRAAVAQGRDRVSGSPFGARSVTVPTSGKKRRPHTVGGQHRPGARIGE